MRHSTHRIRSTHGGNLPRPAAFDALLRQGPVVTAEVAAELPGAVRYVVDRQLECGVDVLNDGEYVKAASGGAYSGYIHQRVSGWEVLPVDPARPRKREGVGERERRMFPGFYESGLWLQGSGGPVRPGYLHAGPPAGADHGTGRDRPGHVHRPRRHQGRHRRPDQGPERQARRDGGLRRGPRPAEPGRGRAQRVLLLRGGVHDRGRRGRQGRVQGDHRRGLHRADRRARVRDLVAVLPRLGRAPLPPLPGVLRRDHQSRAGWPARGPGPVPRLLGQRPPAARHGHRPGPHR